jgi:outer membrane protein assembly factor BamB
MHLASPEKDCLFILQLYFLRMLRVFWTAQSSLLAAFALASSAALCQADDWPQWLGPQRDGIWSETGILKEFPAEGPRVRWRVPIGAGYTGPAVANGRVYVMDRQRPITSAETPKRGAIPGSERILCLNEADGQIVWKHEYDCPYTMSYPAGPRATPVVSDGKVFALGAEGNLFCLDANKGTKLWSHEFKKDYGLDTPVWGFAASPLLDGQKLICLAGGDGSTVVAFDKDTGKELWRALSAKEPGYCPPVIYEVGGKRQLIIFHPQALNSLDPETGKVYWTQPYTAQSGLTIPMPRKSGDRLFVTTFYNGPMMLKLDAEKPEATVLWRGKSNSERKTDGLHSIIPTPYFEGDYIYGVCSYGQLRCLKAENGERVWETFKATTGDKEVRWANAFLIKNGDRFFLPNEKGDLIIAKLSPKGYEEISRTHLLDPTNRDPGRLVVWSHPAFANRCIYARNDKEIVCASLAESQ